MKYQLTALIWVIHVANSMYLFFQHNIDQDKPSWRNMTCVTVRDCALQCFTSGCAFAVAENEEMCKVNPTNTEVRPDPVQSKMDHVSVLMVPNEGKRREVLKASIKSKKIRKTGIFVSSIIHDIIYDRETKMVIMATDSGIYGKIIERNTSKRFSSVIAYSIQIHRQRLYFVRSSKMNKIHTLSTSVNRKYKIWYSSSGRFVTNLNLVVKGHVIYWIEQRLWKTKILGADLPSNKTTILKSIKRAAKCSFSILHMSNTTMIVIFVKKGTLKDLRLIISVEKTSGNRTGKVCHGEEMIRKSFRSIYLHDSHLYYTTDGINRLEARIVFKNCKFGRKLLVAEYPGTSSGVFPRVTFLDE